MSLIVDVFPARSDNFGYLVHDTESGRTAAIDAPEAAAIRNALVHRGWTLTDIFITHHHVDHVEAIPELKAAFGARVVGPRGEAVTGSTLLLGFNLGSATTEWRLPEPQWGSGWTRVLDTALSGPPRHGRHAAGEVVDLVGRSIVVLQQDA